MRPLFVSVVERHFFAARRQFAEQLGLRRVREDRLDHLGQRHFAGHIITPLPIGVPVRSCTPRMWPAP
jgi:hypothetical protein